MTVQEFNKLFSEAASDNSSLDKLYSFFYSKIVLHITVKFGSDKAEDVAQEFFKRILEGKLKYEGNIEYPASFVYRCCDNLAINMFNTEAKYTNLNESALYVDELEISYELREKLKKIFGALTGGEQKLIYLRHYEGYSLRELVPILGMTYGSLQQKTFRILKKLKKINFDDNETPF